VKHYGIWITHERGGGWMIDVNGMIFWTTSRAVAEAQLNRQGKQDNAEVREFE
jgi:hypothetical protein